MRSAFHNDAAPEFEETIDITASYNLRLNSASDDPPSQSLRYLPIEVHRSLYLSPRPSYQITSPSINSNNMDSNVSYTKVEDVECLQDEKEGLQVVTPKNLGFFRGFFIMVAALALTMFIGLVVVVVINDIIDRPRQGGDYGRSRDIAQHDGCRFHIMGLDWLRSGCQDVEPIEKFRYFGPEDWYMDADLEEPCHMDEVPSRVEGSL